MASHKAQRWMHLVWVTLALLTVTTLLAAVGPRLSQLRTDPYHFGDAYVQLGITPGFFAIYFTIVEMLFALLFLSSGIFIFWRGYREGMAVIVSMGFITMSTITPLPDGLAARDPAWFYLSMFLRICGIGLMLLFLFLFPDGRFVPRKTRWIWFAAIIYLFSWLFIPSQAPPIAILAEAVDVSTARSYVPLFLITISGIVTQVVRYFFVSNAVQRQQSKWAVVGVVGFILTEAISLVIFFLIPAARNPGSVRLLFVLLFGPLLLVGATFIPITVTLAVLRYHLWDINFILRRTLTYALLTAVLAIAYTLSVTALQGLFGAVSGQHSPVAIVVSTLIIAALFSPVRGRLQVFLDRRFFRTKYDSGQTLAKFAGAVRDEVDVEVLTDELVHVLHETMQPETVSVWLKGE